MIDQQNPSPPNYGVIDHYLDDKGKEYFDWQGANGIQQAQYNRHIWQKHIQPTDSVLDFGCGGGFLLSVLDARKKVGVEVNPHAQRQGLQLGHEIYSTIDDVPGTFDKVISSHALEHVPNPRQAILSLKAKLNSPASRLLILLPLDDWRTPSQKTYTPNNTHMHLYTWTPQLFGNLLETCDLHIYTITLIYHSWPPPRIRTMLWKRSQPLFHKAAYVWSILNKQKQILAVAGLKQQ
jgi:SAM-dependent methyltransferase